MKSDSLLSVKEIKIYLLQKLILFQTFTEEHLRARIIEIYTERENQVQCVKFCVTRHVYLLTSTESLDEEVTLHFLYSQVIYWLFSSGRK